eukprot:gene26473-31995_t
MTENLSIAGLEWLDFSRKKVLAYHVEVNGVKHAYAANGCTLECDASDLIRDCALPLTDLSQHAANKLRVFIKASNLPAAVNEPDLKDYVWMQVPLPYPERPSAEEIAARKGPDAKGTPLAVPNYLASHEYTSIEVPLLNLRLVEETKPGADPSLLKVKTTDMLVGLPKSLCPEEDFTHWQCTAEPTVGWLPLSLKQINGFGALLKVSNGVDKCFYVDLSRWRSCLQQLAHKAPERYVLLTKRLIRKENNKFYENGEKIALKFINCETAHQLGQPVSLDNVRFLGDHADNVAREVSVLRQLQQLTTSSDSSLLQLTSVFLAGHSAELSALCLAFPCHRPIVAALARREGSGAGIEAFGKLVAIDVLLALHTLHNAGFVHLDVTLENIMLNQQRKCVLIDYGNARRVQTNDYVLVEDVGVKDFYVSPEVVDYKAICLAFQRASSDAERAELQNSATRRWTQEDCIKHDIWCLGVCMLKLLHDMFPFQAAAKFVENIATAADNSHHDVSLVDRATKLFVGNLNTIFTNLSAFPDSQGLLEMLLAEKSTRPDNTDDILVDFGDWLQYGDTPEKRQEILNMIEGQCTGTKRQSGEMTRTEVNNHGVDSVLQGSSANL